MIDIDYNKMYEEVFVKITIQKEFEQYKITQNEINYKLTKENEELIEYLKNIIKKIKIK